MASSSRGDEAGQAAGSCRHAGGNSISGDNNNTIPKASPIPLVEFAVNFSNQADLHKLDEALRRRGVRMVASDLEGKTIQVELADHRNASSADNQQAVRALDVHSLQRYVEQETGFLAVIKGMGQLASAVAELKPAAAVASQTSALFGVIRLSQMENGACFVDGLIEETAARQAREVAGRYSLALHEFGDLSGDNYQSIGKPTLEISKQDLVPNEGSPMSFSVQQIVSNCVVAQQIGKSVALSLTPSDERATQSTDILTAGVIARASTIEANKKQICACSGKTLWQERAERQKEP